MPAKYHLDYLKHLSEKNSAVFLENYKGNLCIHCKSQIENALYKRLLRVAKPSMNIMFFKEIENHGMMEAYLLDESSVENEIEQISKKLYDRLMKNGDEIIERTSVHLKKKIDWTISAFIQGIEEMFLRMECYKNEISDKFFYKKEFRCILNVYFEQGDSHNGGKTTTIIETERGKVVYKPRNLSIDEKMYFMFEKFFPDVAKIPRVILCDKTFGFCEFIENCPVKEENLAKQYYQRLGGFCAIISMLKGRDFHKENLLCKDGYPVPVDLEMMVCPDINSETAMQFGLQKEMGNSLYGSCLMPCRLGDKEISFLFDESDKNISIPVIDGKRMTFAFYSEDFFKGFQNIYIRCMDLKDELLETLEELSSVTVRYLVRATNPYMNLLMKTYEWGWMHNPKLKEKVEDELCTIFYKSGEGHNVSIAYAEAKAIMQGDIPYFFTMGDSKDLLTVDGIIVKDYFALSCAGNAKNKLLHMNFVEMEFECELLRMAIKKALKKTVAVRTEPQYTDVRYLSYAECIERAEDIFRKIAEEVIITPNGNLCWFCVGEKMKNAMKCMDFGLVNGYMGIGVFFAAIYKVSNHEDIKCRAYSLVHKILNQLEDQICYLESQEVIYEKQCNISFFDGLAGVLFGTYLIHKYIKDFADKGICLCERMIALVKKMDLSYSKTDLMTGIAGMVQVICRYDDLYCLPDAKEICDGLSEKLMKQRSIRYKGNDLWMTLNNECAVSGIAHGQAGIASALFHAGKRLSRSDYMEAANAAYEYEYDVFSDKLNGWPDFRREINPNISMHGYCSGAPGIGMDALYNKTPWSEQILNKAIQSCTQHEILERDHLCCGNCAAIEFLLEAGMQLKRPELIDLSKKMLAQISYQADLNGNYTYLFGDYEMLFTPSLFYGAAGVGYELLRHAAYDKLDTLLI